MITADEDREAVEQRANSLPLDWARDSFSSPAPTDLLKRQRGRNGLQSAVLGRVTVLTSHPSLPNALVPSAGDSQAVAGGDLSKDHAQAADLPHATALVPQFFETLKDVVKQKQDREGDLPKDAPALLQFSLIVPSTNETIPPAVLYSAGLLPQNGPGGPKNSGTDLPATVNPDGVSANPSLVPLSTVPLSAVPLRTVPPGTVPPGRVPPGMVPPGMVPPRMVPLGTVRLSPAPTLGKGLVRIPQIPSVARAAIGGLPVPRVPDTGGSLQTHIASPSLPARVLSATAAPPSLVEQAEGAPTAASSVLVLAPVPAAAPQPRIEKTGQTPATGSSTDGAIAPSLGTVAEQTAVAGSSMQAVPAQAPVARMPLPEQTSGHPADAATPAAESAQPIEDRNRTVKLVTTRVWKSPGSKSSCSAPQDSTGKDGFEPEPSGDSATTRKPASAPTRDQARVLAPAPAAAPELPTADSGAPAPGSEPENPETITAAKPAAQSARGSEPPILAFAARLAPLGAPEVAPVKPAPHVPVLSPAQAPQRPLGDGTTLLAKTEPEEQARSVPASQRAQTDIHPVPKSTEPEKDLSAQDSVPAPASFHSGTPTPPNAESPAIPSLTISPDTMPQPQRMTAAPEPAPQAARTEIESRPEPARQAAPARQIQVQVNRGEQRVDVRLTERSGEVLVAVRTPDRQLAGSLREDLPVLSSRLEQAGFRAETWHPAAPASENHLRTAEAHASNTSSQDHHPSRQGGQEQQQLPSRQPKSTAAKAATSSQRKDFAWLMSQLP